MALVPAICTQCGAQIEVDNTHEAGICKFCGTPFITEKAINQYSTIHNVTQNITKIIYGNEKDEASDYFLRGVTQLKIENWVEAYKAFNKACKIAPQVAKYWLYSVIAQTENLTSLNEICLDEDRDIFCGGEKTYTALKSFVKLANDRDFESAEEEFGLNFNGDFKHDAVELAMTVLLSEHYMLEPSDVYYHLRDLCNAFKVDRKDVANIFVDRLLDSDPDGKFVFALLEVIGQYIDEKRISRMCAVAVPVVEKGSLRINDYNHSIFTHKETITVYVDNQFKDRVIYVLDMTKMDLDGISSINISSSIIDKLIYCDRKDGQAVNVFGHVSVLDMSSVGNKLITNAMAYNNVLDSLRGRAKSRHQLLYVSGIDMRKKDAKNFCLNAFCAVYCKDGGQVAFSMSTGGICGYISDGIVYVPTFGDTFDHEYDIKSFAQTVAYYFKKELDEKTLKIKQSIFDPNYKKYFK